MFTKYIYADVPEPTQEPTSDAICLDRKYTPTHQRWSNPPVNGKYAAARRLRAQAKKTKRRFK